MINDLIGKDINGKYRIDSLIRETELGDFYRGTNVATGVPVTVKILAPAMAIDQRYVDRFLADARAAAAVSHANILNSIDIGTDTHGLPFAVFEVAEGETLRDALNRDGQMAVPRAVGIAKQIAIALSAAHAKNLIHGGLNPQKIYVNSDEGRDVVKVFDFGTRGHARNSMASVPYLAPEQTGNAPVSDARTDVYSLGILLYAMVAGEPPFNGATPVDVIRKQADEPPPPLSAFRHDLHPQLEPIILGAIASDPERRYQTMRDFEEDLDRLANETGANVPLPVAVAAAAGSKRSIWQTAFIVVAGVVILAGTLIYATSTRQTNPTASTQPADAGSLPVQPINPATGLQEEALAKLGDIGDASLVPNSNMELPPGTLPGGDGYNAWSNGGVPPAGAPLPGAPLAGSQQPAFLPPAYIPPGGQTVTIDPNGGSQFMPNEGGVILVPIPSSTEPTVKPTPKTTAANTGPKPLATPIPTPAINPAGAKPNVPAKPTKTPVTKPAVKPVTKPKTEE